MTEWKPDNDFLDYLVENGNKFTFMTSFALDKDPLSKTTIEEMRTGKTPEIRSLYTIVYHEELLQREFKTYKVNKQ